MEDRNANFNADVVSLSEVRDRKRNIDAEHERLHNEANIINSGFGPVMKPRHAKWQQDTNNLSILMGKPLIHPTQGNCTICGKDFFP